MTERLRNDFLVPSHKLIEVYSFSRTKMESPTSMQSTVSPAPAAVNKPAGKDVESTVLLAAALLVSYWMYWMFLIHV